MSSQPLRLQLDSAALANNWRTLDGMSGAARAGAAVKANGYGLGARDVVKLLSTAGCRDFFVAHWREAEEISGLVDPSQISVLNGVLPQEVERAKRLGAKPVVNSTAQALRWAEAGGGLCDLMIDSGINRLGLSPADIGDPILRKLDIDICMSHLASADEDAAQNAAQQKLFADVRRYVPARRYSLANSAGICLGTDYHFDLTRPGLALYGGLPRAELRGKIHPVALPQAAILQIRDVQAGAQIGYNATFTAPRPMRLGVVSLGYADGYLRTFSNTGSLHHNGKILPVVGRVSMDLTIVDISGCDTLHEGDWLDLDNDLVKNARLSGLSQYELLTGLGARYDRVWHS